MPTDVAGIHREHIESFLEDLLMKRSAATANNRYRGLVAFFAWLTDAGEIPASPMARMKPPAIPQQPVPVPSTADVQTILKALPVTNRGPARHSDHPSVRRLGHPPRRARRPPAGGRGRIRHRSRLRGRSASLGRVGASARRPSGTGRRRSTASCERARSIRTTTYRDSGSDTGVV